MAATRLVTPDDAAELAQLLQKNREFLAPWDPVRPDDYFTVDGQRAVVEAALAQHAQGRTLPHLIVDDGRVVGRITLNSIVRGPFESAGVGYWVGAAHNGRGLAGTALAEMVRLAFGELRLHRLEAGTLVHNLRSQRVLGRNGFVQFGRAPDYLNIAGRWQDHLLFQRINPEWTSGPRAAVVDLSESARHPAP